jgi:uncharacterized protein
MNGERASRVDAFLRHAAPDWRMGGGPLQVRHAHTAARLLRRDPDIAAENLFTRVVCGDRQGVERLLAERPEAANEKGGPKDWPPLLYLCVARLALPAFHDHAVAIARALLDRGADPNAYYLGGNPSIHYTALTCVAGEGEENAPPHAQRDALYTLLLQRGAEPYDGQVVYNTHFHGDILWWLKLAYARALDIGRKADFDNGDWPMFDMGNYGSGARFLLWVAMQHDNRELAAWLLERGANPNAAPPADERLPKGTLVEEARRRGLTEFADLLIRHGATPTAAPVQGEDAFAAACFRLDRSEARRLSDAHPEYLRLNGIIKEAALRDRADVVALLLDLGTSPDVQNPKGGQTPLHDAAYAGAARVARLLVDRGAAVDPVDRVHDGTPLWWAMWGRRQATIDVLAPISRDVWALNAIGAVDRVRTLLTAEPRIATWVGDQSTPLMWLPDDDAKAREIVELFLRCGADPTIKRKADGKTAADIARERAMDEVAALLER